MATLYPGAPRPVDSKFVLDDIALQDSLAKAMDDAMADIYQKIKSTALPDQGKDDRRLLFCAIARGILIYLQQHQNDIISSIDVSVGGAPKITETVSALSLNVHLDPPV
jgi:hypothetical protein